MNEHAKILVDDILPSLARDKTVSGVWIGNLKSVEMVKKYAVCYIRHKFQKNP